MRYPPNHFRRSKTTRFVRNRNVVMLTTQCLRRSTRARFLILLSLADLANRTRSLRIRRECALKLRVTRPVTTVDVLWPRARPARSSRDGDGKRERTTQTWRTVTHDDFQFSTEYENACAAREPSSLVNHSVRVNVVSNRCTRDIDFRVGRDTE